MTVTMRLLANQM